MTLSYLTAADIAERLGVSASLIRRRAKERGIGIQATERVRLFTEADVEKMKPRASGPAGWTRNQK